MPEIREILEKAKAAGASDVHITVGIPPKMRVNGKLITMSEYNRLLPADTLEIVLNIMTENQRSRFEERGDADEDRSPGGAKQGVRGSLTAVGTLARQEKLHAAGYSL